MLRQAAFAITKNNSAEKAAYLSMARVWVDRWKALGGNFGLLFTAEGKVDRLTSGKWLALDGWERTDQSRDDIPPHTRLTEDRDHPGAVRALEGLLELCPRLRDSVLEVARREVWESYATAAQARS